MNVTLLLLLLAGIKTLLMGAGIGLITYIFYLILNAGLKKADNVINPRKSIHEETDLNTLEFNAKLMLLDGRREEAIACLERMLEIDDSSFLPSFELGSLYFDNDNEKSFKFLKSDYESTQKDNIDLTHNDYSKGARNLYMLGYHYHKQHENEVSQEYKNTALRNQDFVKEYGEFINRFKY